MEPEIFAQRFDRAYQDVYLLAVRRLRDKRERLSAESTAFLLHLAEAGPLTLTELARHLHRAQSTTSEMVDHLIAKALIKRQPDPGDRRRALIWLTDQGREALAEALAVLDEQRLVAAAARFPPAKREALAVLLEDFILILKTPGDDT